MTQATSTRRPQPGDRVRVGDRPQVFTAIDFDGTVYLLESSRGVQLRAGRLAVRLAEAAT